MTPNDSNVSLFGVHFKSNGNAYIFSLDDPKMSYVKENMSTELDIENFPVRKRFSTWVAENADGLLTTKQKQYVQACIEGREGEYDRRYRANFRKLMQRNVMQAYFGNPNIKYYRRLEQDIEKLNTLRKLRRKAKDNKEFVYYILDNLDTNYINELVYGGRISKKAFLALQYARTTRDMETPSIPKADVLNEIYEIVLADIEKTKNEISLDRLDNVVLE